MKDKRINNIASSLICPIPIQEYEQILLAHGGGGKLTQQLVQKMFISQFDNNILNQEHDGAVFNSPGSKLAFSTDSYVVNPIFFPGGNIGELAVYGTVNDLAVCGAKPLYLSLGFIIEEGFLIEDLWKIVTSIKIASQKANIEIVTGDTKVVDRGKGDKIYINTSGVGSIYPGVDISMDKIQVGDKIIINGGIAEHGIAILSAREEFDFESQVKSDTAPLNDMIEKVLNYCPDIHMMRDPTRGGVSSVLNEIAVKAKIGIKIYENSIPLAQEIKAICEILGLDPLYIANEGKVIIFAPKEKHERVLKIMNSHPLGEKASIIGEVVEENPGRVIMKTSIGSNRVVDMLSGEQLPRIC
jgi:hydrogenase expression/formation protein HypE